MEPLTAQAILDITAAELAPKSTPQFDYKAAYHRTLVAKELKDTAQKLGGNLVTLVHIENQLTESSYVDESGQLVILDDGKPLRNGSKLAKIEDWVNHKYSTDEAFRAVFGMPESSGNSVSYSEFTERVGRGDTQLALDVKAGKIRVQ